MKKGILTLALVFVGLCAAKAQVWIGGNASFWTKGENHELTLVPEVGYDFPSTRLSIATALAFTNVSTETDKESHVILSPFFRYSLGQIDRFTFYLDLAGDFGLTEVSKGYRIGIQPCVGFNATAHWKALFSYGFVGYNAFKQEALFGKEGFLFDFAAAIPSLGLYYSF